MTRPAWPPFDSDSDRIRPLDPATFSLEPDRWMVLEWTRTAGGGRWMVEAVLGIEGSEAAELICGEPVADSTPLPWLRLISPVGREPWRVRLPPRGAILMMRPGDRVAANVLLQCTVWDRDLPEVRWNWKAGAITLAVPEHATGEAVRKAVPGLTLLRRVIRRGGPPKQDERRRARAARVRARVAAGEKVEDAADALGIPRSTAYQDLKDFPDDEPSS